MNFFVGHLSYQESLKYWDQLKMSSSGIPKLTFDEAYKVCGGCMHLLEGVHKMYYASGGKIQPSHMSFANLGKLAFYKALRSPDQWKPSDLQRAMKLIITSDLNSVNYDVVADDISSVSLDAMIESNLFHLRLSAMFMSDGELESNLFSAVPVVMPHLPVDVVVMAEILANN